MRRTTVVIIGAGQSGLAMSLELSARSIDHVIIERGDVANSWRRERWDSLKLLTPNWMNNLPGHAYDGSNKDGYMDVAELLGHFDKCMRENSLPVQSGTNVLLVEPAFNGYRIQTDQGTFEARIVVMATGACNVAKVPEFAHQLDKSIVQSAPLSYKRPSDFPEGKVLVVGASASGLQLARELHLSGRPVTLAVGNHTRFPRHYRGRDIFDWMDRTNVTSAVYSDIEDIDRVRRLPSPTLVADTTLDLNVLQDLGVELVGRCVGGEGSSVAFSGSLHNVCNVADLKMNRLIGTIDGYIEQNGLKGEIGEPERFDPSRVNENPRLAIDLKREGYTSILWATGYSPDFSWLRAPVFDLKGQILHDGGVVAEGLYVMGLPYLRYRKSTLLVGASADAASLAEHMSFQLDGMRAA